MSAPGWPAWLVLTRFDFDAEFNAVLPVYFGGPAHGDQRFITFPEFGEIAAHFQMHHEAPP